MPVFTKAHAEGTAKKLKTKPKTGGYPRLEIIEVKDGPHLIQQIWCNGVLVNLFGVKHGSSRNSSHGWVARNLNLSPHRMHEFAICTMSIDEMIEHFMAEGTIELLNRESDPPQ